MLLTFKNTTLIIFLFLKASFLFAQSPHILEDKDVEKVKNFEVLLDEDYTFEQILTASSLQFSKAPKLLEKDYIKGHAYIWVRFFIENNFSYDKKLYLKVYPIFESTFYSYDVDDREWKNVKVGLDVVDTQRSIDRKPILIKSNSIDTIFAKVKISPLLDQEYSTYLQIRLQSDAYFTDYENYIFIVWIVTILIMIFFFIYNLYIYYIFKDITYFYYLLIILGGIIYITSGLKYFNLLLPLRMYNVTVLETHGMFRVDINIFLANASISLILFGFVRFTNSYLKTKDYLPLLNKASNYLLYFYICFQLITLTVTLLGVYYLHTDTFILIENLIVVAIILLLIATGIISLINGYKPARYFLSANIFPLLIMFVITIYLIIYSASFKQVALLPSIAILTQTLTFAIALVARVNLIKDELKEKQLQAEVLEKENNEIVARNRYIELENEYIISEMASEVNQKTDLQKKMETEVSQKADLQLKLESNQRELTANALYLYQKNEMLISLQKQIEGLSYKETTTQNREGIREIKSTLKNDIRLEDDWDKFKIHFEEVHPDFFKELNEKYPTLTKYEIRLSAYYHLNMTAKEIATLLNINPSSVHKSRSRLNKKMDVIDKENS